MNLLVCVVKFTKRLFVVAKITLNVGIKAFRYIKEIIPQQNCCPYNLLPFICVNYI